MKFERWVTLAFAKLGTLAIQKWTLEVRKTTNIYNFENWKKMWIKTHLLEVQSNLTTADKLVAQKLSPIAGFSPILRVPYLLMVTLVIQVLSLILQVSPILRAPIARYYRTIFCLIFRRKWTLMSIILLFAWYSKENEHHLHTRPIAYQQ